MAQIDGDNNCDTIRTEAEPSRLPASGSDANRLREILLGLRPYAEAISVFVGYIPLGAKVLKGAHPELTDAEALEQAVENMRDFILQ